MRIARVYVPGLTHHVIARFVDRRFYFDLEGSRGLYLGLLGRSLSRSDWRCLAYALMTNHIHLLLVAGHEEPERWLKRVHSPFALRVNEQAKGLGPIFADRPKMHLVPDDGVGRPLAYIHNNPVSAGVVTEAAASRWTSHRAYLGHETAPTWLAVDDGLARCGFAGDPARFDAWVRDSVGDEDPELEGDRLVGVARVAARASGREVATPMLAPIARAPCLPRTRGFVRPDAPTIVRTVARILNIEVERVVSRDRTGSQARRVALLTAAELGCMPAQMSRALGVSHQYASQVVADRTPNEEALVSAVAKLIKAEVAKVETVPIQVAGKKAVRAGRK